MEKTKTGVLLMQGNEAIAAGAIAAGINFFAGYPITPATEIAEILSKKLPAAGGNFIQMEDELSCLAAVIGASLVGAKSMTATSGPGFSLMQENLGYAAMVEVPCVVANVQRVGPSTGSPTEPSQGDVMMSRWGTHGDHPIIVLSPGSVKEMFDLTIESFNLSEKYRTPVILLTDAALAHVREKVVLPSYDEVIRVERKRIKTPVEDFKPYTPDEKDIPLMPNFGEGYRFYVSGVIHDETGFPVLMDPVVARRLLKRIHNKLDQNRKDIIKYESKKTEDAEIVVISYGCLARPAKNAVITARNEGIKAGLFRPITLWPSPSVEILNSVKKAHTVIVPEMNTGQYSAEISKILHDGRNRARVVPVTELGNILINQNRILSKIRENSQNANK